MGRLVLIMEILSNFISIYCSISFIAGEMLMLAILSIVAMCKAKEPKNKIRFYVTKNNRYFNYLQLWIGKPKWVENYDSWVSSSVYVHCICNEYSFKYYKLNPEDFDDMKVGEIREVFINLED